MMLAPAQSQRGPQKRSVSGGYTAVEVIGVQKQRRQERREKLEACVFQQEKQLKEKDQHIVEVEAGRQAAEARVAEEAAGRQAAEVARQAAEAELAELKKQIAESVARK